MGTGTPPIIAVERTLATLEIVLRDRGRQNVAELAAANAMPLSTAHRQIRTLIEHGYLIGIARGRHVAGPRLLSLTEAIDPVTVLEQVARPALKRIALASRATAHLGVLENDMVTYLIKEASPGGQLFTEEGKQLEAYCSGIGKVLLAYLPESERERYLVDGPFTALTARTITDPGRLRDELANIRHHGFAIDDEEVASGIQCVAVPILWPDGTARAAISIAGPRACIERQTHRRLAFALDNAAGTLAATVFGGSPSSRA